MGTARYAHGFVMAMMVMACNREPAPSPTTCPPCPTCAPAASASAPPAASASASAPRKEPASEDEDLYCRKGDVSAYGLWKPRIGEWLPTPEEVEAAVRQAKFACAPRAWLAETLSLCVRRLGQAYVVVRWGVMDGERATKKACDIVVGTAEWNGRTWVSLYNDVREDAAFFGYVTSLERTPRGWIVSTEGCQLQEGKLAGSFKPIEPKGWKTFPEALKTHLCPP